MRLRCNIPSADEMFEKACRHAGRITVGKGRSKRVQGMKLAMSKIRTLSNLIGDNLISIVKEFPNFEKMHPFYREIVELEIDKMSIKKSLSAVKWAASMVKKIEKIYIRNIKSKKGAPQKELSSAYGRIKSILNQIDDSLDVIRDACKKINSTPTIDFSKPVVVVAGSPNVGKSMLVSRLSTASPEVAYYPFTTKGIIIGHVKLGDRVFQIVDTPGLLDRPPEKQNPLEKQAMLALRHLSNLILFILDPSEMCGIKMEEQEKLLNHISENFKDADILVVENKSDIMKNIFKENDGKNGKRIRISAKTGEGIEELVDILTSKLHFEYLGGASSFVE